MQAAEELKVYITHENDDAAAIDDSSNSNAVEALDLGGETPFTIGTKEYADRVSKTIETRFKRYAYDQCKDLGLKIGSFEKFNGEVGSSDIVTTCNLLIKALGRKIKEENPYIGRGVMGIHDTLEASRTSRLYVILTDTEVTQRYIRYLKYLVDKSLTPLNIEQVSIPRIHVKGQDLSAICDSLNMRPEDTLLAVALDMSSIRHVNGGHRLSSYSPTLRKMVIDNSISTSSRIHSRICPYLYKDLHKVYRSLTVSLRKLLCFQTSHQ